MTEQHAFWIVLGDGCPPVPKRFARQVDAENEAERLADEHRGTYFLAEIKQAFVPKTRVSREPLYVDWDERDRLDAEDRRAAGIPEIAEPPRAVAAA